MPGENDVQMGLFLKPRMTHYLKGDLLRADIHWALRKEMN